MSISDLEAILNKEAIIPTYSALHLRSNPGDVEQMYLTHAKTHIPLGKTSGYVDTIFKWVGGKNKGAFVGCVVGDYGHGKTSFLVHVWNESTERKVFTVPPFSWKKVSDMLEGTAAWLDYILEKSHPDQARKAKKIYNKYKEQSLLELANKIAEETGEEVDHILKTLKIAAASGATVGTVLTIDRLLNYCSDVAEVVKEAGYVGLLLLLDEPEVAAKELGFANVSQILFEIANGLLQGDGNYGMFVSMPEKFLATATKTFGSLPARLQARNCMVKLRDIYGADFAEQLWLRYVQNFGLENESEKIVAPLTLQSIGQVTSSDRKDLSYGPRTVVSAFRQMVHRYDKSGTIFEVEEFVEDCLEDEILVSPDYPSRIRKCFSGLKDTKLDERSVKVLAGFPDGITTQQAKELRINTALLEQARSTGIVYKLHGRFGFAPLRKKDLEGTEREPDQTITEIFSEFAPAPAQFEIAKEAFVKNLVPLIFEQKTGHGLEGWDPLVKWVDRGGVQVTDVVGSFKLTAKEYPRRLVTITVGPVSKLIPLKEFVDPTSPIDMVIRFLLRWDSEEPLPEKLVEVSAGTPEKAEPASLNFVVDLGGQPIQSDKLQEIVDPSDLTPLGILYLLGQMDRQTFPKEVSGVWEAMKKPLLLNLFLRFFQDSEVRKQAAAAVKHNVSSAAAELIPSLCKSVLKQRYPEYSTLIRQPQWKDKVDDYIRALDNQKIPLSCKRGREQWKASKALVASVFNTNPMNLNDFFSVYETLIDINMGKGREDQATVLFKMHPLEKKILEKITAEKPPSPLKVDGRECWWIDLQELIPLLLYSGYQHDEIMQIANIGKARGTFFMKKHRGWPILYCKPLDPEQMKVQLTEKLEDLKQEFDVLKKLPGFRFSFDFDSVEKMIDGLADDADFEKIQNKIHRQFEVNHDKVNNSFVELEDALASLIREADLIDQRMSSSRHVASLKSAPTGLSRWCTDLRYLHCRESC